MIAKRTDLALWRRLVRQARAYWPHLAGIFLLSLISTPLTLLTPLPLKIVVDSLIGSQPVPGFLARLLPTAATGSDIGVLGLAAALVVAIGLLDQLQRLGSSLLSTYTGEQLVLAFRARLFRHVQRLSLAYHDSRGSADSTYRIQYDAPAIQWSLVDGFVPFITATITLAGMIYVTARIDGHLAVVALGVSPVLYVASRTFGPRLRSQWLEVHERQSSAMSVVQEVLGAVRVVKAFGQEEREHARFVRRSREGVWARIRVTCAEGGFGVLVGVTVSVGGAAILFIGARHVRSGALTVGELLIVVTYLSQLCGRLQGLSQMAANLQGALACAERAFALLDQAPDVLDRRNARSISRASGAIAFRHVAFTYGHDRTILRDISFEIGPGTRAAIVGATGAGKTTLVSLLMRFYDPTTGQILLDGIDLRECKLADLRNQFAIVLQEPVLFSATIAENIAYARPEAAEREITAAAKAANAHEFIVNLPEAYATQVGDRGMRLSGGQRQLISLARAFLRDAPVLILDEPTSAVDAGTEAAILEAMERLMPGRTTFIIAHRLSTLKNCDISLRIDDGRLVAVTPGAPVRDGKAAPSGSSRRLSPD